ncbi:MAG: hypothetical protein LBR33_09585 [Propionibacteriaceae bacterium]|jgi:hypothetical protein|nr:hypothetical protein [Propionibacteriaceae bacterium]
MRRRIGLGVWFGLSVVAFWPTTAYAYIDPATTSYLIQVVSGLLISASVAIGVFFRRIQLFFVTFRARLAALTVRWFTAKGRAARRAERAARQDRAGAAAGAAGVGGVDGLDGLAGLADVAGLTGVTGLTGVAGVAGPAPARRRRTLSDRLRYLFSDRRHWYTRLGIAALTGAAAAFTFVLFAFLDLYVNNQASLPFWFDAFLTPTLLLFGAVGLAVALVLCLFRGRVFDVACSLVLGVTIAGWVQANFLNPDFGQFTGATVNWPAYLRPTIANTAIWLGIIAAPVVVRALGRRLWHGLIVFLPALLIAMGSISLLNTYAAGPPAKAEEGPAADGYLSAEGLFTVSRQGNEIVFLLDMLDQTVIDRIRESDPHFFDPLQGFTEFDNNLSRYSQSFPSIVNLLTGGDYLYQSPMSEFFADAWREGTFLPDLKAQGYSVNVYSLKSDAYWSGEDVAGLVDNFYQTPLAVDQRVMLQGMARLAGFTFAPLAFKPALWLNSQEFDGAVHSVGEAPAPYAIDDAKTYATLVADGLTVVDSGPRFSFIHLWGPHPPFTINADAQAVPEGSVGIVDQAKGAFKIVYTYLADMAAAGVLDNSTIVITGDHGIHTTVDGVKLSRELDHPAMTALFVKPAGAADAPLVRSQAPTAAPMLKATLVAAAGGDPTPYGPTYFDVPADSTAPREFFWLRPRSGADPPFADEYEVVGDATNFSNWHKGEHTVLREDEER